jgi:hypothetical protein
VRRGSFDGTWLSDNGGGLVRDGLATAAPLKARIGGRLVEVTRVMITAAGLRAVAQSKDTSC